MKILTILSIISTLISCSNSNIKNVNIPGSTVTDSTAYPLAVSFNSICCGTASSDFLKSFLKLFNQKNKTDIAADIAAGCGREGEFVVLFKLPKTERVNTKFETELKALVEKTNAQNKKANNSSGSIALLQTTHTSDYKNCRLGITPWDLK